MSGKYAFGTLITYVLVAGIVVAINPSGSEADAVSDGLLWPISGIGWLWDYAVEFYGPMFG